MEIFIHNVSLWLDSSKYFLLFSGSFLEGPVVMIGGGFLYRLEQVELLPTYIALVLGDFVADVVWYFVGYFGAGTLVSKYGKFFNITPEIILKVEGRFKAYQTRILLLSKLTMGFGFSLATLITAGMLKVSFKQYAIINLLGGFVWVAFMILIGFFFGNIYIFVPNSLKIAFVALLIFGVIFAIRAVNRYLVNTKI